MTDRLRFPNAQRTLLTIAMCFVLADASAQGAAPSDEWRYRVEKGDNLISLAKRYLTPATEWQQLQKLNGMSNANYLSPGSIVRMPVAWLRKDVVVATVRGVQGSVSVASGSAALSAAPVGAELKPGDRIETGAQSTATLAFVDGSRAVIAPKSKVLIETLLAYGKTGITETRLKIEEGGVDSQVVPMKDFPSRYVITTPVFNLGVRGTDFRARYDADSKVAFSEVLEGGVAAQGSASPVIVGAGFGTLALVNTEPKQPKKLLDAPALKGFTPFTDRVPVQLAWQPEPGASAYRAQVFADASLQRQLVEGVFIQPGATWPTLADGSYTLRVRGIDAEGLEGASTNTSFVVKARPLPPAIRKPAQSSNVYGPTATFNWETLPNAERFRLQIAKDAGFKQITVDNATLRANELMAELSPGTYFWRVATLEAGNKQGPFGDVASFSHHGVPISPLILPVAVGADEVVYRWELLGPDDAGRSVQYQLSAESQFLKPMLDKTTSETQVTFPKPSPGTYYFRAKTIAPDGFAGKFGSAQVLVIEGAPRTILNTIPRVLEIYTR